MNNLTINDIKNAKMTIGRETRKTPLVKSYYLSSKAKGDIYLKLENRQLTGSFNFRGAFNKISSLTDDEKAKGVIACSAGNHAQGVALSCHLQGIESTIVMPTTAPQAKVDATRGYGSKVILFGETFDDAKSECELLVAEQGLTFLHTYDDIHVMAGQGTIGIEILEDLWDVDTLISPIGGVGLISDVTLALKSFNPNIKIIGVQADQVHGMKASIDAGEITRHFVGATMADGCSVQVPGNLTFEIAQQYVDEIVTISEDELEVAMKDLLQRGKDVVEGAGELAKAAVLSGKVDDYIINKKTVTIISGGNVDLKRVSNICDHFISAEI